MEKARVLAPTRWRFGKLPTEVLSSPDLSTHAKLLMGCLLWHGEGEVFPGQERLAAMASCSKRQVQRAIKELERFGLRVAREKGGVNVYDMQAVSFPGGGVVTDSHYPNDQGSSPQATASHPNENNLNESKGTKEEAAPGAVPAVPPPGKVKKGEPKNQDLKQLVTDWYDTFLEIRKFKDSTSGGMVAGILGRLVAIRSAEGKNGAAIVRWELTEYWSWLEKKGVHGGDIRDFKLKENMLHDMYLERTKRRDD